MPDFKDQLRRLVADRKGREAAQERAARAGEAEEAAQRRKRITQSMAHEQDLLKELAAELEALGATWRGAALRVREVKPDSSARPLPGQGAAPTIEYGLFNVGNPTGLPRWVIEVQVNVATMEALFMLRTEPAAGRVPGGYHDPMELMQDLVQELAEYVDLQ